jgi:hypothetical protein
MWQGRLISARIADVRRSLTYLAFLGDEDLATSVVVRHTSALSASTMILSYVMAEQGWMLSKAAQDNLPLFYALLRSSNEKFRLSGCVGGRLGKGVSFAGGLSNIAMSLVWFWPGLAIHLNCIAPFNVQVCNACHCKTYLALSGNPTAGFNSFVLILRQPSGSNI